MRICATCRYYVKRWCAVRDDDQKGPLWTCEYWRERAAREWWEAGRDGDGEAVNEKREETP